MCIICKSVGSCVWVHVCHGVHVYAGDISQSLRCPSSPSTLFEMRFIVRKCQWQLPGTLGLYLPSHHRTARVSELWCPALRGSELTPSDLHGESLITLASPQLPCMSLNWERAQKETVRAITGKKSLEDRGTSGQRDRCDWKEAGESGAVPLFFSFRNSAPPHGDARFIW